MLTMLLRSFACLSAPLAAQAAVILHVDSNSFTVAAGGSFQVDLALQITDGDELIGLDYFWGADPAAAGLFTLAGRDAAGSPITDAYPFAGDLVLDSRSTNLGGLTDIDMILTGGSYFLGTYVFTISPFAAPAVYQLAVAPDATWLAPDFSETSFAALPSLSIAVSSVPDKTSTGLLLVAAFVGCAAVARRAFARAGIAR